MALALTDRLPTLDKDQLLNLMANARRLQADAGPKAEEAGALLPLIEAELSGRSAGEVKKVRAKPKAPAVAKPKTPAAAKPKASAAAKLA